MKVVCDTSSIIELRKGGVIDCLGQLFEAALIPQAVKEECKRPETKAVLEKTLLSDSHRLQSDSPLRNPPRRTGGHQKSP